MNTCKIQMHNEHRTLICITEHLEVLERMKLITTPNYQNAVMFLHKCNHE